MPLTVEDNERRKQEDAFHNLEMELLGQREIIRKLQTVVVRGLVILKHVARIFALVGCYIWLGKKETFFLAVFIVVIGVFQLIIDKVRKIVNPKVALSEWDVL